MVALVNNMVEILAWGIGWPEIVVILIVVLLLFGGKKLPELARGLARGLKSFKREMHEVKDEFKDSADADDQPPDKSADTKDPDKTQS